MHPRNTSFLGCAGDVALCLQCFPRRAPWLCDGLMHDGQRKRPLGGLDGWVVMEAAIRLGRAAPAPCAAYCRTSETLVMTKNGLYCRIGKPPGFCSTQRRFVIHK